jgi:serine/threonine protein kinase
MKELIGLLSALHDDGYVHLDLKDDNILLDQDCKMLLCDGGLSNTIENLRYQRIRWRGLESSWHIAPEIRSGVVLFHPGAADMYSAGTLLASLRIGVRLYPLPSIPVC